MESLIKELGDSVTVSGNILIPNRQYECLTVLMVNATPMAYEITIDRPEKSVYEVMLSGEMFADFSISKQELLNLVKREPQAIFDLVVLYDKFCKQSWFDIEKLSQKIIAINDNNYEINMICHFMAKARPQQMKKLFDEAYDLFEAYKELIN